VFLYNEGFTAESSNERKGDISTEINKLREFMRQKSQHELKNRGWGGRLKRDKNA